MSNITKTSAEQLTEIIMTAYKQVTPFNKGSFPLPIKSIDGVICDCRIRIQKFSHWNSVAFYAESKSVICSESEEMVCLFNMAEGWNPETDLADLAIVVQPKVFVFCQKLLDTLPNLKLTIKGNLRSFNEDAQTIALHSIFGSFDNIQLDCKIDTCCVCYNQTTTKTQCKHSLCYRCWFSISKTNEEGELECLCPLCREEICYV
jgi:hypothetical protein